MSTETKEAQSSSTKSVQKFKVQRFELLMDAGFGAQKSGDILIRAFANTGRSVFIEPMFPAEISPTPRTPPALSGVIIRVAEFDLKDIGNNTDLILAQHEIVLNRRLDDKEHNPNCRVLLDFADKKLNEESYETVLKRCAQMNVKVFPFEMSADAQAVIRSMSGKGKNMYYIGILGALYNVDEEAVINEIKTTFGKKLSPEILQRNIDIFHLGNRDGKEFFDFSFSIKSMAVTAKEKILIDGNSALTMGIIDAGIKMYSGYPITPASSIMHTLAKELPSYGGIVHQAEDEISAIGAAIGAYYGGMPAATGTSGPGISLKQEFISYASAAEASLILIDVQRSGPSTGMPTRTEQSDLLPVIFGAHGDYTKIVISVGNILDCFYAPALARYLTEKLKMPVFIMSDFMMANSYKVIEKPIISQMENVDDIKDHIFKHFWINRLPDKIEHVRAEQALPGTAGHRRMLTGLNTDDKGVVNYFSFSNQRSHVVRNKKVHLVRKALKAPEMFGKVTDKTGGDVLVVGWGSSRGVIAEAVHACQDQGLQVGGMCFRIVYPLPLKLNDIFEKFKYVVTVELSYGDHLKRPALAMLLRSETRCDVQSIVCHATGRPIAPQFIISRVKQLLEKGLEGLDFSEVN